MTPTFAASSLRILACALIAGSAALPAATPSTFSDSKTAAAPGRVNLEQQARSRKLFQIGRASCRERG